MSPSRTTSARRLALLAVLMLAACDSWHGDNAGGFSRTDHPVEDNEDGSVPVDAGSGDAAMVERDGGRPSGGPMDAGAGQAGPESSLLGDERAGHVLCSVDESDAGRAAASCSGEQTCCSTNGADAQASCQASCGPTEVAITCDGPEDCEKGQVCCHRFSGSGLVTECIALEAEDADAGPDASVGTDAGADAGEADVGSGSMARVSACGTLAEGPEQRVACHDDRDCRDAHDGPVCRSDAPRRPHLGYCTAAADDPLTVGHDDEGVVGCGDPAGDLASFCSTDLGRCCLSKSNPASAACTSGICGFSEVEVVCDGPEDCAGNMCCHVPGGTTDAGSSEAAFLCADDCSALGDQVLQRCHTDNDCAEGARCEIDERSPFWGVCR